MTVRFRSSMKLALLMLVALAAMGCPLSGGKRVEAPSMSPSSCASQALAQYDANKDGYLAGAELDACPALKDNLKTYDTNGDGKISADEISSRLQKFRDSNTGLMSIVCQVELDNRPLAGATVTLVPEAFMGTAFKPATGVSDESGFVSLTTEGAAFEGVACGLYRVEVSKKDSAGNESIPAKYNSKTTLGQEISPDPRGGGIHIKLKSR